MKVDHKDVTGVAALRALYKAARNAVKPQTVAYDALPVEQFPNASRQIKVM
ncbi:MAG: hypothetical protein ACP5FH_12285 [Terracidiphilus sp.]